jgi:hypothetical protein
MTRTNRFLTLVALSLSAVASYAGKSPDLPLIRAALHEHVTTQKRNSTEYGSRLIARDTALHAASLKDVAAPRYGGETDALLQSFDSSNSAAADITGLAVAESMEIVPSDFSTAGQYDWAKIQKRYPGRSSLLVVSKPAFLAGERAIVEITEVTPERETSYLYEMVHGKEGRWVIRWKGTPK